MCRVSVSLCSFFVAALCFLVIADAFASRCCVVGCCCCLECCYGESELGREGERERRLLKAMGGSSGEVTVCKIKSTKGQAAAAERRRERRVGEGETKG